MEEDSFIDPADLIADVVTMLVARDGVSQNEAISAFMSSDIGRKLMTDPTMASKSPEQLLKMFDKEVRRSG